MKTEKEKLEWVLERLKVKVRAGNLNGDGVGGDIEQLSVYITKNKLGGIKKTEKKLLERHYQSPPLSSTLSITSTIHHTINHLYC